MHMFDVGVFKGWLVGGLAAITCMVATEREALADEWYNGCDYVADAPAGYDFTMACNWHDLCYGGHIAGYDRAGCDKVFGQFMDTICVHSYGGSAGCLFWAAAYYAGTGAFGSCFYDGSSCDGVVDWFDGLWRTWSSAGGGGGTDGQPGTGGTCTQGASCSSPSDCGGDLCDASNQCECFE